MPGGEAFPGLVVTAEEYLSVRDLGEVRPFRCVGQSEGLVGVIELLDLVDQQDHAHSGRFLLALVLPNGVEKVVGPLQLLRVGLAGGGRRGGDNRRWAQLGAFRRACLQQVQSTCTKDQADEQSFPFPAKPGGARALGGMSESGGSRRTE